MIKNRVPRALDPLTRADSDAQVTESESDADVEKQFDKSMGKKRQYHPFLEYHEVGRRATGEDSELEPAEIKQAIKTKMKKIQLFYE